MELEKPAGPVHHGGSSGSGIQRDDATRTAATRNADARPLEASDVEMNAEDPCAAQVKRAKTIMGLEICMLESLDDVFDEPPATPTNLAGTPGENETDEDARSDGGAEPPENAWETLHSPECGRADASDFCAQLEDQRTVRQTNDGRRPRTRAWRVVFSECVVRDPENSTESWHQDGSWQVR